MLLSQYLLESSFCLLLFYGFYHFWLRKETFFQLNRAYLLATPTLSLMIPYLDISLKKSMAGEEITYLYPILDNADQVQFFIGEKLNEPTSAFTLSLSDLVLGVYFLGVLFMFSKLILSLFSIFQLIKKHSKKILNEENIILTNSDIPNSSFFSFIFWNASESPDNQRLILEHEKVHVRQRHSLDVLWMEFLVILKWFNPLIYLFRNALRVTHEFIADAYILKEIAPVNEYATALVQEAKRSRQQSAPNVLSHTFAALIKQRLNKMIQPKSSGWKMTKYAAVFPLMLTMMVLFSFNCSEALPGGKEVGELSEYLDDLGDKTVFEIDGKKEHYLQWGDKKFSTMHFRDEDTTNLDVEINYDDLMAIYDQDIRVFIRGKERIVTEMGLAYLNDQAGFNSCSATTDESKGTVSRFCLSRFKENLLLNPNFVLTVLCKTRAGELIHTNFLVNGGKRLRIADVEAFQEYMRKFCSFTTILSNIDLDKNIFKSTPKENYLEWGDNEFDLGMQQFPNGGIVGSNYNLTINQFKKLANQKLVANLKNGVYPVSTIQFKGAHLPRITRFVPDEARVISQFKNHSESIYKDYLTEEAVRQIIGFAEKGHTNLHFEFTYLENDGKEKEVFLGINILNPDTENWKDLKEKGIFVNRTVANFQLINQRDRQTIIKMDTTSEKYRWMYENYRDGKRVKIVHIPDFKTITRVVTLADELVPETDIAESHQLINQPKNAIIYPEFYELMDADVLFTWRGMMGIFDGKVSYLDEFKKSNETEMQLMVDGEMYKIVQFDLVAVPVDSPAIRFVADSAEKPEIQQFIHDLELRTSLYVTNILIENEDGEVVLFPLRFAFNLM